jgi:flagellar hook protein FlgE
MADLSIPLQGMSNALSVFNTAAGRIAAAPLPARQNGEDTLDLSAEMVSLLTSKNSYQANLSVAKTVSDMQGSLFSLLG